MLCSFRHATSKYRQKKQSNKQHKQSEVYITNDQYEEPLEQRKARILERKFASSVIVT